MQVVLRCVTDKEGCLLLLCAGAVCPGVTRGDAQQCCETFWGGDVRTSLSLQEGQVDLESKNAKVGAWGGGGFGQIVCVK